ncbi:hypothetical protein ABDK56_11085 [Sphingomonas sp. ASV193]|uniref:hypothetical protein n=1 Tax=Sphingomonas sp. ASV193 TaxID=3144405 RepID=UPI0032E878C5
MTLMMALAGCDQRPRLLEGQYDQASQAKDINRQCVLAGQIAAIYLEKNDDENYKKWETQKGVDCFYNKALRGSSKL